MDASERSLVEAYEDWTKLSRDLIGEARRYFPGGDTRTSAHYTPYPAFVESGRGCRVIDADGHEYVDFMNNFTSLIHGHAHPGVVEAIAEQASRGTAYAAPTRSQLELARILCERVPGVDLLRFCSSGSEATLMALRAARAFTGRQRIMKIEGGYHGSYDLAEVSLVPFPDRCGPLDEPVALPVDRSIAESAVADVVVIPYNEPEIARRRIAAHAHELACVIVEPVLGSMGMIPATAEFLRALREATAETQVLLVFDEVISLRTAPGGAQEHFGVLPDLTAMGKILGGGLPIGAIGGRRDVIDVFNPDRRDSIMHASTFSGNPLSMAAGIAGFRELTPPVYERLNALGERLLAGFGRAFGRAGVRGGAVGLGSLANVHFGDGPLRHARDSFASLVLGSRFLRLLHLGMLRRGIFAAGRQMYCISTPMGEAEIDAAAEALEDALRELRPAIEAQRPELLR